MPRKEIALEAVEHMLMRCLLNPAMTEKECAALESWASLSIYNRSVLDDIRNDEHLRSALRKACGTDQSKFWSTVITHRAALHPFMPPRRGNFWQRMLRPVGALFDSSC